MSDVTLPELAFADATDLAELVRRRALHPRELVAASIARIERLNPALNAVVTPMFEQALAAAARMQARMQGDAQGRVEGASPSLDAPFAGVPTLVKDLIATCAGVRHTNGTRLLSGHVARRDSELVARLRRAGLVPIGLTNTSELGGAPITESALFGATCNPWDTALSPAGSSGGSATAVAAGIVPVAHGNDTGGSLRNPASCCGVFALKPSRGRMPLEPAHGPLVSRLLVEHVLTRSVRDSARVLDHTHGALPGDPHPPPSPHLAPVPAAYPAVALPSHRAHAAPGHFEAALALPARRLRIALSTRTLAGEEPHPDCAAAAHRAAALCERLGHEVVHDEPGFGDGQALVEAWFALWAEVIVSLVVQAQDLTGRAPGGEDLEPRTRRWWEAGWRLTIDERVRARQAVGHGVHAVAELMERCDVWLTPTLALPAIPLGAFDADPTGGPATPYMAFSPYTRIANMTGCPAMSVPLHQTAKGFPVGAHFLGRMWEEATLLGLAHQLEQAAPWRARRPPVRVGVELGKARDANVSAWR
jgi:amidase